jgi:hypothetical protein
MAAKADMVTIATTIDTSIPKRARKTSNAFITQPMAA